MKLVVCGGAGFMGSDFANTAAAQHPDWHVVVVDKLTYAANPQLLNVGANLTLEVADICDGPAMESLCAGAQVIVNFAAESHNDRSLANPQIFTHTNVVGTQVLLEVARAQGAHFHQISTDEVYGDGRSGTLPFAPFPATFPDDDDASIPAPTSPWAPTSPLAPSSPYSASKAAADLLVMAWVRSFGVSASISRSTNNFGPGQHPEKFIPRQILRALTGQPLMVYGDGRQRRDWLYVADHTAAVLSILDRELNSPARTWPLVPYHIGTGALQENRAVAAQIAAALEQETGRHVPIDWVADRPGHDHAYHLQLGTRAGWEWQPAHGFASALAQTIAWYQANPGLWEGAFSTAEAFYRGE